MLTAAVLHWIICWNQKFALQGSTMSSLFKNYWLVEITYLLIRFNKTKFFLWNTKNTARYGVNKQNTHYHSLREWYDWKGWLSIKTNDRVPLFLKTTTLLYQPLPFYGKNLNPRKILKTQTPFFYKQNMCIALTHFSLLLPFCLPPKKTFSGNTENRNNISK